MVYNPIKEASVVIICLINPESSGSVFLFLLFDKSYSQSTLHSVGNSVTLNYLVGDGKTNQTARLQKAIDSCGAAGGGTLVIPKGTFFINPITLKSNVYLYLNTQAILLFNTDTTLYVKNNIVRS